MKKIFIIWIILSLLLSSCSIDWDNEKDKKIAELEKQIQNDTFKKKQECAEDKLKMEKEWYSTIEKIWKATGDPYSWEVSEIFYSKKLNTCIYVFNIYKIVDIDFEWQEMLLNTYVFDFFSKKEIISSINNKDYEIEKKIKDLKWE